MYAGCSPWAVGLGEVPVTHEESAPPRMKPIESREAMRGRDREEGKKNS